MDAISVKNVSKSYGRVKALDDVSFSVGKGEVFGLIGPDGAGKTCPAEIPFEMIVDLVFRPMRVRPRSTVSIPSGR